MKLSMALHALIPVALLPPTATGFTIQPRARRGIPQARNNGVAVEAGTRAFATTTAPDSSVLGDDFVARMDQTPMGKLDDVSSIRSVMADYAERGDAPMVEKLLFRMVDEWYLSPTAALEPTTDDFYMAIHAWSQDKSPDANNRVGLLFLAQEDLLEKGVASVTPDARTVHAVLRSLSSSRERGADRRAWSILERVSDVYGLQVDAEMYGSVIRSLARSKQRDSAERAEKVLRQAVAMFPPGLDEDGNATGITVDSFNVILTAWAKSGAEDGPKRAEDLLVYMDQVHKENREDKNTLTPNVSSFTSLIDAYAQKNDWNGVSKSEQVLNRLLDQYLEGEEELEPNVASWTIVISAWTRLARKNYNRSAERADKLLRRMEELYQEGRTTVAPDAITYVTVMNAWAASRSAEGPQRAEEILGEMYERYLDGEDEMRPSTKSIKVVIDSWIKMEELSAMDRAEAVLDKYEDFEEFDGPIQDEAVQEIYRSMLFGWSKHKEPRQAEEYLRNMVEMGIKPDCFCYDRIIEAYTQRNAPDSLERTYAVFELMDSCSRAGDVKPNERVYTSFIRALTKARVKGLAKKATLILKKMDDLYESGNKGIKPTTFTYNAVLNACAETVSIEDSEPLEAFKVAIGIFNDLCSSSEGPDHVTFGNMLRCAALLPEGEQRDAVLSSTFQLCCKRGLVNSYVIRDLQYASTEELWRSLLRWPEGGVDCEQLPVAWRNQADRKHKTSRPARGRPKSGRSNARQFSKKY